jgi:hypothetical protein
MPITERTLRRWRGEALRAVKELKGWDSLSENTKTIRTLDERILKLTQELLDQHLLRKVMK